MLREHPAQKRCLAAQCLPENANADSGNTNSSAHLPYLVASDGKYEIKALCNSSVKAAQAAVKAYKLPSSTKAYGDPKDLANDPDVRRGPLDGKLSLTFSCRLSW